MTDTTIAAKIAELDAVCPCRTFDFNTCRPRVFGTNPRCSCLEPSPQALKCDWRGHRLARELAKVAQEREQLPKELATAWNRYTRMFDEVPHGTVQQMAALVALIPRAALPIEEGENE